MTETASSNGSAPYRRVVVFVAIVGERVGAPGGDGTFTACPPVGAPNGKRFGSALPLDAVVVAVDAGLVAVDDGLVAVDDGLVAVDDGLVADEVGVGVVVAAETAGTPPGLSASETSAAAAMTPVPASTRDLFNMLRPLSWAFEKTSVAIAPAQSHRRQHHMRVPDSRGRDYRPAGWLRINYRTLTEGMAKADPVIRAVLADANVPTSIRILDLGTVDRARVSN